MGTPETRGSIEGELSGLSPDQQKQVTMQLEKHQHGRYETNIALSDDITLEQLVVYPEVLRPESMTSTFLAQHLHEQQYLYRGKTAIDIGCGSGVQGIVMGIDGAKQVTLADISEQAVANAKENVAKFQLTDTTTVVQSNLFDNVQGTADVIVFNHPFFPTSPIPERPVSISMLDSGELIQRFLRDAKFHLTPEGVIVMPYFQLAGETNNPKVQGEKNGYDVTVAQTLEVDSGLQKGSVSIYHLTPKK